MERPAIRLSIGGLGERHCRYPAPDVRAWPVLVVCHPG
jgi:hypothetical protein